MRRITCGRTMVPRSIGEQSTGGCRIIHVVYRDSYAASPGPADHREEQTNLTPQREKAYDLQSFARFPALL